MTAVHHCVGGQRCLMMTLCTLETVVALDCIAVFVPADRTNETIGPLYLVQIFSTGFFVRKFLDKLTETQSFLLRHNWHHLYDTIIQETLPNNRDTDQYFVLFCTLLIKTDNLNQNLFAQATGEKVL